MDKKIKNILNNDCLKSLKIENLFNYQKEGVLWLIDLYSKNTGGILADDMGLGKTAQTCVFIHYLILNKTIKSCIIVMPKSVIENWKYELMKWCPNINIEEYGCSISQRKIKLYKIQENGGILLTTYGLIRSNYDVITRNKSNKNYTWDIIIVDEGHVLKKATLTSKNIRLINTKFRLILTGTPIQNNLMEFWHLMNFISFGELLGNKKEFKTIYADIIESELKKCKDIKKSSEIVKEKMEEINKLTSSYILRRTKYELCLNNSNELQNLIKTPKEEYVLWIKLSLYQIELYKQILQSYEFKNALIELNQNKRSQALIQITLLRFICNHPNLVKNWNYIRSIIINVDNKLMNISDDEKSCKILICIKLIHRLINENHKILIFSQSRSMLDEIIKILVNSKIKYLQIDGRITKCIDRQKLIEQFQNDKNIHLLLMTTQTGGVGLNITSADRVIMLEPSWNPGTDNQAIDRAWRIGQINKVIVYRLVTCGTVEEKMYRRQVYKSGLIKFVHGELKEPDRYFTNNDLIDLMTLADINYSETYKLLKSVQAKFDLKNELNILYNEGFDQITCHSKLHKINSEQISNLEQNKISNLEENNETISSDLESYENEDNIIQDLTIMIDYSAINSTTHCSHFDIAKKYGFTITKCRCHTTYLELTEYYDLLNFARNCKYNEKSLEKYLEALNIIDDDLSIQIETRIMANKCNIDMDENSDFLSDYAE